MSTAAATKLPAAGIHRNGESRVGEGKLCGGSFLDGWWGMEPPCTEVGSNSNLDQQQGGLLFTISANFCVAFSPHDRGITFLCLLRCQVVAEGCQESKVAASHHPSISSIPTSQHPNIPAFQAFQHPNIPALQHPNISASQHPNIPTSQQWELDESVPRLSAILGN